MERLHPHEGVWTFRPRAHGHLIRVPDQERTFYGYVRGGVEIVRPGPAGHGAVGRASSQLGVPRSFKRPDSLRDNGETVENCRRFGASGVIDSKSQLLLRLQSRRQKNGNDISVRRCAERRRGPTARVDDRPCFLGRSGGER